MATAAGWFLAVTFAGSAAAKAFSYGTFLRALARLPWMTARSARRAARLVPALEFGVAILLVTLPLFGATAALMALVIFSGVAAAEISSGRPFTCGCFGSSISSPADWTLFARNGLLAAAAVAVLLTEATSEVAAPLVGIASGGILLLAETTRDTMAVFEP